MNRNQLIRKFFGVVLLASFALANTPTTYLHWLFANHKDFRSKTLTDSRRPQINAPGIDCHCSTNVVVAPYAAQVMVRVEAPLPAYRRHLISRSITPVLSLSLSLGLRGPPSIC